MRYPKGAFLGIGISIILASLIQLGCGIGLLVSVCTYTIGAGGACFSAYIQYVATAIVPTVLHVITGSIGIGAACSYVGHRRAGLTNGFMAMCILSALLSITSGYLFFNSIGITFSPGADQGLVAALWIGGIATVVLFILCVVGASYSCCCSPVYDQDQDHLPPSYHTQERHHPGYKDDRYPAQRGYRDDRRHY